MSRILCKKLLVIQAAGLGYELLRRSGIGSLAGLEVRSARSVLPAVTCSVQASFRTASLPAAHGMIGNGIYDRRLHRPMFWEQSADLVEGERIWSDFRRRGGTVGLLFWQQSLGEQADVLLSPAPIHRHGGGLVQDCYSKPADLYPAICKSVGSRFNLMHYWGPLANWRAGGWIAAAAVSLLASGAAPDLCMVYLPTLDYDLQRYPPSHPRNVKALAQLQGQLSVLARAATAAGYEILIFGDYAIGETSPTDAAVFPNRALAAAGLMATRTVRGMMYPDFHAGRAFAMVDHEVAHVYVRDQADIPAVAAVLTQLGGVARVVDRAGQAELGLDHRNSGELVLLAGEGRWFAYPWWTGRDGPDYASHVDIHSKPGYDPCELFFGWPPWTVGQDTSRIRGSHGCVEPGREVAWAASFDLASPVASVIDLGSGVREFLNKKT